MDAARAAPSAARRPSVVSFLARSAAVGVTYAATRGVALAIAIGFGAPAPAELAPWLALELAAGLLIALTLTLVAQLLAGSSRRRIIALGTLIFMSILAVLVEGAMFQPAAVPLATLPLGALLQLGVAIVTALAVVRLVDSSQATRQAPAVPRRAGWSWLWRYVASALTYVVLYFVTGAINYSLVTRPYYESRVGGLAVPEPATVLMVALLEGFLLPLAVVPLLYALSTTRRRRALVAGGLLFVLGGLMPLLISSSLPVVLRVTSAVEILFQKLPVGAVAALLLGPKEQE